MHLTLDKNQVDFEHILRGFPTPYLILKSDAPHFTIVGVSHAYLIATKTIDTPMIGKKLFEVFPDNPQDSTATGESELRTSLYQVLKSKKPDVMGVQRYDIPITDSQEFEVKYWSVINSPILQEDNSVSYIIHRAEDVTEFMLLKSHLNSQESTHYDASNQRLEAEIIRSSCEVKEANRRFKIVNEELEQKKQELSLLNERLKELDRLKTDFFSNVSHEFRTPLTLMIGPIEDIIREDHSNKGIQSKLEIAHRNALRLLKLVNTLLDFSRIEAGRAKATYQPTDITKMTVELASHFDSATEKSGIKLIIDCQTLPEQIYIDREFYEKIVLNLISNAFKHTFEGEISVNLSWTGVGAELTVQDTGIGIPQDQLEHIFERFHRVPNAKSRTYEGSGIGLALVQELVKLHHGTIHVTSIVNHGSKFTVFFPAGKSHLSFEQIDSSSRLLPSTINVQAFTEEANHWIQKTKAQLIDKTSRYFPKILLADDNLDMRNYICQLLEPYYEVTAVNNGSQALKFAKLNKPDLILSDVMMPEMNGFELVNKCRDDPSLQFVPFILLSARAGEDAKIEGLETGADDYLIKPFSAAELLTRIKTHLALQKARLKAQGELEKAAKLKNLFISNMSHELRTPLNAIIGYSEMIINGMATNSQQQHKFVENISKAGKHLLALINDILDLSKIEAGKFILNLKCINISDIITDLQTLLIELAANKEVSLKFYKSEKLFAVKADPVRLKQILINLLNNAIKFNKSNGQVDIHIDVSDDKLWVVWKISDTGIGIPKDKIGDLFTEFYQIDNSASKAYEGTGLGLALTKKLVELHGGSIWVDSEENIGSTFTFTLPAIKGMENE